MESYAQMRGIDTSRILWTGEDRVGTYYLEFGSSPRANRVLYDRAHSAIARIRPGMVDWDAVLDA